MHAKMSQCLISKIMFYLNVSYKIEKNMETFNKLSEVELKSHKWYTISIFKLKV